MNWKINLFLCLTLAAQGVVFGQMKDYTYKRSLGKVSGDWGKIIVPEDMFEQVNPDFSDIRVYGILASKDTIEAPYILSVKDSKVVQSVIPFKVINQSYHNDAYYFSLENQTGKSINQIELNFDNQNFDWRLNLEGSNDQKEWFSIVKDYRILSIKNQLTSYSFSKINFPESRYSFFRIKVDGGEKPHLNSTKASTLQNLEGDYNQYPIKQINTVVKDKKTIVEIHLNMPLPIGRLGVEVTNSFDYYRPFELRYIRDSIKIGDEWRNNYSTLTRGVLSSLENNEFTFSPRIAQRLQIIINNDDNENLDIGEVKIYGPVYQMITRFSQQASYYLVYGKENAVKPSYDIDKFKDIIPTNLPTLTTGQEKLINDKLVQSKKPLFASKLWLWLIIGIVILLLGGFTLKMIKER